MKKTNRTRFKCEKRMKRILVCEKEEVLLTALEFRMRKQGYEVDQAPDGKVALEKIREKEPDMVIIGTEVKKVPGLDVIREIRESINPELPIIVIAPLEAEGDIMKAYQLGANDFVTKPFKPVELVLRVRRQFEIKRR